MKRLGTALIITLTALPLAACNPVTMGNSVYNHLRYQLVHSNFTKCKNIHNTISIFNTNPDLAQRFELEIYKSGCLQLIDEAPDYSFSATVTGPKGWESLDMRLFQKDKIIDIQKYRCNGEIQICVTAASNDIIKLIIPPHLSANHD